MNFGAQSGFGTSLGQGTSNFGLNTSNNNPLAGGISNQLKTTPSFQNTTTNQGMFNPLGGQTPNRQFLGGTTMTGQPGLFNKPSMPTTTTTTTPNFMSGYSQGNKFPTPGISGTMGGFPSQGGLGIQSPSAGMSMQSNFMGIQNVQNLQSQSNMPKVLRLNSTNFLKYEKLGTLSDEIKKVVYNIETTFKNNEIAEDYANELVKQLQENFKLISAGGVKVIKLCKVIYTKNLKLKAMSQNLKQELKIQTDFLEKEKKNFNILEHHHAMKITVPSEYLFGLVHEFEQKMAIQMQNVSDLEALINLYYRKEYGTFKVEADIVEEVIKELYHSLTLLVSDAAKINEYVNILKANYAEYVKSNFNWSDFEIENRLRSFSAMVDEEGISKNR